MFVDCGGEDIDGKQVVRVTVRRGTARPYYLRGKGIRQFRRNRRIQPVAQFIREEILGFPRVRNKGEIFGFHFAVQDFAGVFQVLPVRFKIIHTQ